MSSISSLLIYESFFSMLCSPSSPSSMLSLTLLLDAGFFFYLILWLSFLLALSAEIILASLLSSKMTMLASYITLPYTILGLGSWELLLLYETEPCFREPNLLLLTISSLPGDSPLSWSVLFIETELSVEVFEDDDLLTKPSAAKAECLFFPALI